MSKKERDQKPVIPEIKVEETDPSSLTVSAKLRRYSDSILAVASASLTSTPTPTTVKTTKMLETLNAQWKLKESSIEEEFAALEESLQKEIPDIPQIEADLHFLTAQVKEAQKIHGKILDVLVKNDSKTQECVDAEKRMGKLIKRLFKKEKETLSKLKTLKEKPEEDCNKQTDDELLIENEEVITEKESRSLHTNLIDLETEINREDPILENVADMLERVQVCWQSFLQCQTALVDCLRNAKKPKDILNVIEMRKNYQERMIKLERQAKELLDPPERSSTSQTIVVGGAHDQYHPDLPKLASHPKEWLPFWAIFKETHDNKNLTQIQKFRRLLQATKEGSAARDTVNLYAMSSSNYTEALAHLKRDYGRDNVQVKIFVRELLQIAIDRSAGKQYEFRKMVNEVTANLRNLETFGVTSAQCSQFLYPMLEACLPRHTLQLWQEKDSEDLKELVKFLQKQVEKENDRKLAHFSFSEQKQKEKGKFGGRNQKDDAKKGSPPAAAAFHNKEAPTTCIFCENRHPSQHCRKALNMSLSEKQERIKTKGACFVCLIQGHMSKGCPNKDKTKCEICGKAHTKVLCPTLNQRDHEKEKDEDGNFFNGNATGESPGSSHSSSSNKDPQTSAPREEPPTNSNFSNVVESTEVPLQMLLVTVEGRGGRRKKVRALLDTGSQKSYVTQQLADEMEFANVGEETVIHQLFGGATTPPQTHQRVKLQISGANREKPCNFDVSCISRIAEASSPPATGMWINEFKKRGVIFPQFTVDQRNVDVLIGNDVAPKLFCHKYVELGTGPVAMETRWGWVLGGKIPVTKSSGNRTDTMSSLVITTTLLNSPITGLWDLDLIGIRDEPTTQSKEELAKQTEEHFLQNVKRNDGGRYEVKLPFLNGAMSTLPSNFHSAEKRLKNTTESLRKSDYLRKYDALFKSWEAENMIEAISFENEENWREIGHFLPHRAVIKLSSATTPIRPVFDASAKQKGRPSLNMCLDAGPNYLELIPSILTRFRLRRVGVTADIRKAFQQISVAPEHRPFLRFLWWEDPSTCRKLRVYQHSRVVFGVSCSPFLLAATLQHHLRQSPTSHLKTAEKLMRSLYVDNCFESLSSLEEALKFQQQSLELMEPAKFDLREWGIGPTTEERELPALGLIWDMRLDELRIDVDSAVEKMEIQLSQRNVLALAHSLFDPLGMLTPFIFPAKLILRSCHEEKLGWDKPLPAHLAETFNKWKVQVPIISEIRFPRYVDLDNSSTSSLHVFSDASGEAYAAAVFLRCKTPGGVRINLLQSKARIASKAMKVTIPRLELIGCLIGVRLAAAVREDIGGIFLPTTYYTDSSTSLARIQGDGPWGVFVENRVHEIRKRTTRDQWRHVRGKDNPADLPSRGCSAKKLADSKWWMGPNWMYLDEKEWPVSEKFNSNPEDVEREKKKMVLVNLAQPSSPAPIEQFLKFSSYPKLLRAASYWMRFKNILRARIRHPRPTPIVSGQSTTAKTISPPTVEEREIAEKFILQHTQKDLGKKQLKKLRPFMHDGLMRTSTPIFHDQEDSFVHPIILPDNNEFVYRLLRHHHEDNCHIGTQLLLGKSREKFWIVNGRRTCRKVVTSCWICRRFNARKLEVPEPPLPRARTETGVPFHVIGVDMAGPLIPKKGEKVWVALFTCATYRAVHLEVVDGMSTDEFFAAFRAFTCRRGKPQIVYSDNGLNFVGANAALQLLYQKETEKFATEENIQWRLQPPNAPWHGGFFERLIGLVKSLLRKILGKRAATKKELVGLLMEVEEAVNNRPLTYLSESPDDPVPLTPNMMIRNSGLSFFPEMDIRDATHARAAFRKIQRLREMLRSSFRTRYLGCLQNQRKGGTFIPLKPGDVVLLEQENMKRVNWPLGVIVEAIPGRDQFPRKYLVKTKSGVVPRAAQKLFPMELQDTQGCATGVTQREAQDGPSTGAE